VVVDEVVVVYDLEARVWIKWIWNNQEEKRFFFTEYERIWLSSFLTPNVVNGVPSVKTLWYRFGNEPLEPEFDDICWTLNGASGFRFSFSLNK